MLKFVPKLRTVDLPVRSITNRLVEDVTCCNIGGYFTPIITWLEAALKTMCLDDVCHVAVVSFWLNSAPRSRYRTVANHVTVSQVSADRTKGPTRASVTNDGDHITRAGGQLNASSRVRLCSVTGHRMELLKRLRPPLQSQTSAFSRTFAAAEWASTLHPLRCVSSPNQTLRA